MSSPRQRHGCFWHVRDVWRGAVMGDFAREKGVLGTGTQIVFGFLPAIGTLCAMRDFVADWRARDTLGAVLNLLAFIPFLGGFPKMVDALHSAHQVGRLIHLAHRPDEDTRKTP